MNDNLKKIMAENLGYSEADLKFIETALVSAGEIESYQAIFDKQLRILISSQDENNFYVHIGDVEPYKGGSGINYEIQKTTGKVTTVSTEIYDPAPRFGED